MKNGGCDMIREHLYRILTHHRNLPSIRRQLQHLADAGALDWSWHERRSTQMRSTIVDRLAAVRWFSQITPEFYSLENEKRYPAHVRARLVILRKHCLNCAFPPSGADGPTIEDIEWTVNEAKSLLEHVDNRERAKQPRNGTMTK